MPRNVLMVCVGNICRSPIAEAVMRDVIARAGLQKDWHVESAAIEGWHHGSRPDERALRVLAKHNIECTSVARQLQPKDFVRFDYILAMDRSNMASLKHLAPKYSRAKLLLLGDFGLKPDERSIEDPYYLMGTAPFEKIYKQCTLA
ncbi:low molecular weight phosphotyrosine protein phosphatase 2 isoform X2 [Drosophila obscura]|nr:low molecular weight phosphotyrosine protein phosphatase 2 isoform X2 [Drosophila obscura]